MTDCSFCSEQKNCPWAAKEYLYCSAFKKKSVVTNGDRIRAMTNEELAVLLANTDGDFPPNVDRCPINLSANYWLDWLRSEVDD